MKSKVALVHNLDREKGIPKVIGLLEANPVSGKAVVLKPNFNTADPFPASTHRDTLRTLMLLLKKMRAENIILAERSGMGNSYEILKQKEAFSMGEELGFNVVDLDDVGQEGWIHISLKESHWSQGFNFARVYAEAESVVQTCCLKTHRFGGHFTLSLKNSVGMVKRSDMGELHSSPYQRQMIAEVNQAYSSAIILMDGIEVFVSGGPEKGLKVNAGVLLASDDRVAIDAVGVAVIRLFGTTPEVSKGSIFEQEQIARAVQLGLGVKSPQEIEFVTGDGRSSELVKKLKDVLVK